MFFCCEIDGEDAAEEGFFVVPFLALHCFSFVRLWRTHFFFVYVVYTCSSKSITFIGGSFCSIGRGFKDFVDMKNS